MKKVCLADWDGTFRQGYLARDWLIYLNNQKVIPDSFIHSIEKELSLYQRKKIDYERLLSRVAEIYASAIKGINKNEIMSLANIFIKKDQGNLFRFSRPLFKWLRKNQIDIFIISGAPIEPLSAYAKQLFIEKVYALEIETVKNEIFVDRIKDNYGFTSKKREAIKWILDDRTEAVLAIGNSSADIPLFEVAKSSYYIIENKQNKIHNKIKIDNINFATPKDIFLKIVTNIKGGEKSSVSKRNDFKNIM